MKYFDASVFDNLGNAKSELLEALSTMEDQCSQADVKKLQTIIQKLEALENHLMFKRCDY